MTRRLLLGLVAALPLLSTFTLPHLRPAENEAADAGWLAQAQQQIAAREYHASENGEGLQAPNRAHDLRTYFDATGIRVHDRTGGGSLELLRLSLAGVGRGETLAAPTAEAEVVADENRVEIRRPGLVEWYVNSEAGLEQGFTLAERPAGQGALVVELAVAGARLSLHGDAVRFETGAGRKLRYGELVALDAMQRPLAAHFEVANTDGLRLVVDDIGAAYPVVIDPLLTDSADTLLRSGQDDAQLGYSVAGAGDVDRDGYADVIVGALRYDAGQVDEGAAFLFLGSAGGIGDADSADAAAQLEGNQARALFGWSVAGAGDVNADGYADVIVGAISYDAGQIGEGAAFVFLGSASGIADGSPATAAAQLESDQQPPSPSFSASVASAGDVNGDGYDDVIVGAPFYDAGQTDEGAAFIFLGSAAGIADGNPATAATQIESDQAVGQGSLGGSVAGAGDVNGDGYSDVIVAYPGGGAALVFLGGASGIADGNPTTASTRLVSVGGASVSGAGDVNGDGYADVIVGADSSGAAFVFHGGPSGVPDGTPATAATNLQSDQGGSGFGASVAGAGDVNGDGYADVIVGAFIYQISVDLAARRAGAAFVFLGSGAGVASASSAVAAAQLVSTQPANAFPSLDIPPDFGRSVASAGDVNGDGYADVIVGAPGYNIGQFDEGAAFVFHGGAALTLDGDPTTTTAQIESDNGTALLGAAVAGAGDVNGDGYGDVIVGAYRYDAGHTDEGAAFLFLGSASGIPGGAPGMAAAQLEANQNSAFFGRSVAGAGDVNGDGYADVIVGAPQYSAGLEGAAFVFHGSASGIASGGPASAAAQLESNQPFAGILCNFGFSVAGAGDVDGDGYTDVIVGAPGFNAGEFGEGAGFVFHGSPAGIADANPASPGVTRLESNQENAQLGNSVGPAGDVNGDGYADVIVGASRYDVAGSDDGAAFVFHGSGSGIANGTPATAAARLESDQGGVQFGASAAGAGDVNGDGYADVIVGAPFYFFSIPNLGSGFAGAAFVFHGSAAGVGDGTPATAAARIESWQPDSQLGRSVASAGDLNGDGYADVIVGAPMYEDSSQETNEGVAFVLLGSEIGIDGASPVDLFASAQLESNQAEAQLGMDQGVASAGDVNGDGFADLIVGAHLYDAGTNNEGAAWVFLGNGTGRSQLPRQRRGDGSGIAVAPWGGSHSPTSFAAEIRASHPQGRGRVRAEFEACPPAVPFGDASCDGALTPGWVAVNGTTPEVVVSHTFSGLVPNSLYRWRARVLHAPATGPIPAEPFHGPWLRHQGQAGEGDVRVIPEPGLVLSLASGAALLGVLGRLRRGGRR